MRTPFHPSATLLVFCCVVLAAQVVDYGGGVFLLLLCFLSAEGFFKGFFRFVRRSRWLLLVLWLVFAYGQPGEAWLDQVWLPTLEGMAEANLHLFRLLLVFAALAWLLARLSGETLLLALWGVLQPLQWLGLETGRLVIRLSLVLDYLRQEKPLADWRRMLHEAPPAGTFPATMQISMPAWTFLDRLLLFSSVFGLLWIVL